MTIRICPIGLVLAGTLCSRSVAQDLYMMFDGRPPVGSMGWSLSSCPDLDGDGSPEIVIGAPFVGLYGGGAVLVRSGRTGEILAGPVFGGPSRSVGVSVAGLRDFDGDGVPDFAAGDTLADGPSSGEVVVHSGVDASALAVLTIPLPNKAFGWGVWDAGDLDGDGLSEVAGSAINEDSVWVFHGGDGVLLRRVETDGASRAPFATLGDLTGDGVPEYTVGWRTSSFPGKGAAGLVKVYDGAAGTVLVRAIGEEKYDHLGSGVAPLGDVNGDGIPDFAAGAPGCGDGFTCAPKFATRGWVRFYSGADGSVLRHIDGPGPDPYEQGGFGMFTAGGGDVNGDGYGDLLVSGLLEHVGLGAVSVISGRTGTLLWKIRGEAITTPPGVSGGGLGAHLAIVGDMDLDGDDEFAIGDDRADFAGTDAGRVWVFQGFPGDAENVCTTSPNSVGDGARLSLDGPISRGNDELRLRVSGAVPNEVGHFFYGPDEAFVPYGDGVLCVGGGAVGIVRLGLPVTLDASGAGELAVDFFQPPLRDGPTAWGPGSTWVVQFAYRDLSGPLGTGFNASDAVRITVTP